MFDGFWMGFRLVLAGFVMGFGWMFTGFWMYVYWVLDGCLMGFGWIFGDFLYGFG